MVFSKSFGYAIRGLLFLSMHKNEQRRVQLDEIAEQLNVPRYFMGKVMKRLVKNGIIDSVKGHNGGFYMNTNTREVSLMQLCEIMGESQHLSNCMLGLRACSDVNPCPFHHRVAGVRDEWKKKLTETRIADLLADEQANFLESIVVN